MGSQQGGGDGSFRCLDNFEDSSAPSFACAIMGDLHLEPTPQMALFDTAREQLRAALHAKPAGTATRVVQLGDLGGYKYRPGSRECFERGREYLQGFGLPTALVTGNHDLEGDEFETDEQNLAAWQEAFGQRHYWAADVGPATFIGLSTVRFRSNPWSVHEVHVDEEQLEFFRAKLREVGDRPVVVFTHAPIMGSGLKVVQTVHVKNRCAWLNHSGQPRQFIELVERHPNIKLWFSGHFHLSHNYSDSISVVGGTAFVLTGVIGEAWSRDGFRQSRVLEGDGEGYKLYTMDHDNGELRLDLQQRWDAPTPPKPIVHEDDLICDPTAGWLCSQVECEVRLPGVEAPPAAAADPLGFGPGVQWFNAGPDCMLALQNEIIVEYDTRTMSAVGVVSLDVPEDCTVALVDEAGTPVDTLHTDGSAAVAVEVRHSGSQELHQRIKRNQWGSFFQIYQPNKWVANLKKKEAEAAAAAAAAAVPTS